MSGKRWTEEEIQFLKDNYRRLGLKKTAEALNRAKSSVMPWAAKFKLSKVRKNPERWSENDDNFVKGNYLDKGGTYCAKVLNRSKGAVNSRARILGLSKKAEPIWTNEEIEFLKANYFSMGLKEISKHLDRSYNAIGARANSLNLEIDPNIRWKYRYNQGNISELLNLTNPIVVYFWGLIWADGTVNKKTNRLTLIIRQPDFLEIKDQIMKLIDSWRYFEFISQANNLMSCLNLSHVEIKKFLFENDYTIKSGASADKILSKIPENLKHYWWRGYFDGDGHFSHIRSCYTTQVIIASCFDQDWKFAEEGMDKIGVDFSINKYTQKLGRGANLVISGESCVRKFCEYIYNGIDFGLNRKKNAYLNYVKYKDSRPLNKYSKFRGILKTKNGRWRARIKHKSKTYYTTIFDSEIEAAKAYNELAIKHKGNKAILNKIS